MDLAQKIDKKKLANLLIFGPTLIPLVLFLYIIWNRVGVPIVFEWGESAGINQINRILAGTGLYGAPTLEFAPLVYTPLYYYLSAGLAVVVGSPLLAGRILSLISLLLSLVIIGRLVYKETGNPLLAWVSGISYLACFSLSGGYFDLLRVDSLYILLVVTVFAVMRRAEKAVHYAAAGALLAAGFFIKQSLIIVFLPLLIYFALKRGKRGWLLLTTAAAGSIIPVVLINLATGSWFGYYVFQLPKEHGYSLLAALNFWIGDTLRPLGIFIAFSLVYLMRFGMGDKAGLVAPGEGVRDMVDRGEDPSRDSWWIYLLFFGGAVAAAWITRSSNGGGANNGMVFYAALAVTSGLGAGLVLSSSWVGRNPWNHVFVAVIISLQFIGLIYNPFDYLPKEHEIRYGEEISRRIEGINGQILIPYRSHLSQEVGPGPQIHMVNLFELTGYFGGDVLAEGYQLVDQLRESICRQSYGLIVLDQPVPWFDRQIDQAYILDPQELANSSSSSKLLEWQQGPSRTYLPRQEYSLSNCLDSIGSKND